MVPTPAPNSRRPVVEIPSAVWTNRFRPASASHKFRKAGFAVFVLCAFFLPNTLSISSQAEEVKANSSVSSQNALQQSPVNLLPQAPISSSSSPSTSQPQSSPEAHSGSGSAISSGDSTPAAIQAAGTTDVAAPAPSSLSPVTSVAPLPNSLTAPSAVQPQIRVRAIVSGQERQSQIAVKPKMTVGQALVAMGISLAALDRVMPDASAIVHDSMTLRVTRIKAELKKSRAVILPTGLRYQPTTAIKAGAQQTVQQCRAGVLETTERVWTRDGQVTKREFVSRRIIVAPQPTIVALGVKSHLMPQNVAPHRRYAQALSARGGSPRDRMFAPANPGTFAPVRSLTVMATGYAAGPAGGAISNYTATGVRCTYGAVAVDPRLIPLGSKLYIEGYGYGFACDTGGAIRGNHIDLAFDSARAAFQHGKKHVKVWILGR